MKPHHKPHAPRQALAWLRNEPGFARLGEQATRLAALQADLARGVPTLPLTVVAFERDTLVLGAAHAAVAAKVRQMEPTILGALARRGWRIRRSASSPSGAPSRRGRSGATRTCRGRRRWPGSRRCRSRSRIRA